MNQAGPDTITPPLVCIVDDEACVRESLSSLIRSVGYRAEGYASAESFLARGNSDETACLILDVRLAGMDGIELQRRLALDGLRHPPIVFISGHATGKDVAWALHRGAVAFLRKPFSDESLLAAVRTCIARRSAQSGHSHRACPVCHEPEETGAIPADLLAARPDLRETVINTVEAVKPGWTESDGLCERCWHFYFSLARSFKSSSPQPEPAAVLATHGER